MVAYISDPSNMMNNLNPRTDGGNIQDLALYFGGDPNAPTKYGRIASVGQLQNFGVNGPAGTATYTPNGINLTPSNDLYRQFGTAAGNQLGGLGQFNGNVNDYLSQLFQTGGANAQSNQANSLFQNFGTQLGNFDVNNAAGSYTDILNRLALPKEQQAANSLGNRLFAAGRLGANDTTAGRAFGDLAQAQAAAQDQRSLAAYNLANTQFQNLANATNTFGGLGSTLQSNNVNNMGKIIATPSALDAQSITNASNLNNAANASLSPLQNQVANLFTGGTIAANQKQSIANGLLAKFAANQANGKNAGWGGALSGAISGATTGFEAGGPWGALAGGIIGGGAGYYGSPGGSGAGGAAGGSSPLSGLFSMFGQKPAAGPTTPYDYGNGTNYPAAPGSMGGGAGGFGIDNIMGMFGGGQ